MIVAIDGPAGSGKSTIAAHIANEFSLPHINSGSLYRAITHFTLNQFGSAYTEEQAIEVARQIQITFIDGRLLFNDIILESELRTAEVDENVPKLSSIIQVRSIVNDVLKHIAGTHGVVTEGRDITTVVFPDADIKLYLDASIESRTQRRLDQGFTNESYEQIFESIRKRDEIDKNKAVGALKIADDAHYLDTSLLTINQVCEKVVSIIKGRNKQQEL